MHETEGLQQSLRARTLALKVPKLCRLKLVMIQVDVLKSKSRSCFHLSLWIKATTRSHWPTGTRPPSPSPHTTARIQTSTQTVSP